MRVKAQLLASLLINVVLGGLVSLSYKRSEPMAVRGLEVHSLPNANPSRISPPQGKVATVTIPVPFSGFDWRQVESEDYREYLGNLRAMGCPEKPSAQPMLPSFAAYSPSYR